jgi:hypothetical protein
LVPEALGDKTQVIQLAQRRLAIAPTKSPSGHDSLSTFILGLAYYRVGQFAKAVELLDKNEKESPDWDQRFQLVGAGHGPHHKLKNASEARQWLAKASQWIEQEVRHQPEKNRRLHQAALDMVGGANDAKARAGGRSPAAEMNNRGPYADMPSWQVVQPIVGRNQGAWQRSLREGVVPDAGRRHV